MAFDAIRAAELSQRGEQIVQDIQTLRNDLDAFYKQNSAAPGDAIDAFAVIKFATEGVSEAKKVLEELVKWVQYSALVEKFTDEVMTTMTTPSRIRATMTSRTSVSILDKEAALDWLKENGYESLVQETVNSSTLAGLAGELLREENRQLPDNMFRTSVTPYISLTRVK